MWHQHSCPIMGTVSLGWKWADIVAHNTQSMQLGQLQASSEVTKMSPHFLFMVTESNLGPHGFFWWSTSSRAQESSLCSTGDLDCTFPLAAEVLWVIFVILGLFQAQERFCFLMYTNQFVFMPLAGGASLKLAVSLFWWLHLRKKGAPVLFQQLLELEKAEPLDCAAFIFSLTPLWPS